ncbi:MAG: dihydropyrimidinase [Anaerolineales bacterium]
MLDLAIRGGTLVTASEILPADAGVQEGRIACIGQDVRGREEIDATGLLVLPGAIDPHVHLAMPTGVTRSADDWRSGTIAAACGGTTTVIDFVEPEPGERLASALAKRRAEAADAVIDYGLHMTITDAREETLAQIPDIVAAGAPTFKTYTVYEGFRLDDGQLLAVMAAVRDANGMVLTHCENDAIVRRCTEALLAAGESGPGAYPRSRPIPAEGEAITRVLALAEVAQAPLYVVHISTARGAAALREARARGQRAYGETCPQYLLLTEVAYGRPGLEAAKFVCAPPLRAVMDNVALWKALARDEVQVVATDHCPFNVVGQKELGRDDFTQIPGGLPSIELRLSLVYGFGVVAKRLSLQRWVEVCSTAPARLFGLYPQKGTLFPGADADIVLFDPEQRARVTQERLHEQVDYTPYEGLHLHGAPVMTLARGRVIAREGEFVGQIGTGRFLERALSENHA